MPREIESKTILNKAKRRDPWFLDDYTLNPYSSCSFNCLFCYIRGSKYGEHMEHSLAVKTNAVELLEKALDLHSRKGRHGVIVMSSATDPYLHFEDEYKITRQCLELILKYRFPVHMITRSDMITRDIDLLSEIDKQAILPDDLKEKLDRGAIITFSFSTLQDEVGKIFEPGATPPSIRLQSMAAMQEAGFLTGVSLMPLLPFISDTTEQLELAFSTFAEMKADYVMPATLTLFGEGRGDSKTMVFRAVAKHYPELLDKYQKFFAHGTEMPRYYQEAFYKKMEEMGQKYNLPYRIIDLGK